MSTQNKNQSKKSERAKRLSGAQEELLAEYKAIVENTRPLITGNPKTNDIGDCGFHRTKCEEL